MHPSSRITTFQFTVLTIKQDQPAFRHLLMERIRGATDPMTRACLNLVDKPYLDMAFHKIFNGSDCELCQRNHPHESQIAIRAKCGIKQMKAVQDSMYLPVS